MITEVLTLGTPSPESREFRVGCRLFKKTRTMSGIVIKHNRQQSYVRRGVARIGAVYDEELAALAEAEAEK